MTLAPEIRPRGNQIATPSLRRPGDRIRRDARPIHPSWLEISEIWRNLGIPEFPEISAESYGEGPVNLRGQFPTPKSDLAVLRSRPPQCDSPETGFPETAARLAPHGQKSPEFNEIWKLQNSLKSLKNHGGGGGGGRGEGKRHSESSSRPRKSDALSLVAPEIRPRGAQAAPPPIRPPRDRNPQDSHPIHT